VEEVNQKFVETFIRSGRGLDVIQEASAGLSKLALPSWVPDWSTDKLEFNSFDLTGYYGGIAYVDQSCVTVGMMPDTTDVEAERMCVLEEVVAYLVRPN
jgi:hypothetical protein